MWVVRNSCVSINTFRIWIIIKSVSQTFNISSCHSYLHCKLVTSFCVIEDRAHMTLFVNLVRAARGVMTNCTEFGVAHDKKPVRRYGVQPGLQHPVPERTRVKRAFTHSFQPFLGVRYGPKSMSITERALKYLLDQFVWALVHKTITYAFSFRA